MVVKSYIQYNRQYSLNVSFCVYTWTLCLSVCLSLSRRSRARSVTVFWDLTLASFTAPSPWALQKKEEKKKNTHLYTMVILRGGKVCSSVILTHPSLLQSYCLTPPYTHSCHPTPPCINASNPLCGRVTSATVRNRVKLNRHRENGRERSSTDNQAALQSGPPLGLCHLGKTRHSFPSGCSCLQLENTQV